MSVVNDAINAELNEAMKLSISYSSLIKEAKTKTKVDYFKRKIEKNNNKIAKLLLMNDSILKNKK